MEKSARKKSYWGRNSNISNNVENGGFSQNGQGGQRESLPNGSFLEKTSKGEKNRKFESYDSLISVHQTDNSYRFAL